MNKNQKALIFINPTNLIYFEAGQTKPLQYNFPENAVSDIEVHDLNILEKGLKDFFTSHKIIFGHLILFLSKNITFQKEIPATFLEATKQEFLDTIPFENISSRLYSKKENSLLIATNKDLISKFQTLFSTLGFEIDAVIPEEATALDLKDYSLVLNSYLSLLKLSLISNHLQIEPKIKKIARKQVAASKNLKLLILLFGVALIILGGAYLYSQRAFPQLPSSSTTIPGSPPETVIPGPASPAGRLTRNPSLDNSPANLSVKIYYLPDSQKQAQILQNNLWRAGFKNTDISATSSGTPRSTLSLSPTLPATLIQKIKAELTKVDSNYLLDSSTSLDSEIKIFLSTALPTTSPNQRNH